MNMAKPGTRQQKRELGLLRKKYGTHTVTKRKDTANQKVRNAKVTVFEGIEFKSGLELFTYKHMKENGLEFVYEQHKFEIHPEFICGFHSIEQEIIKLTKGRYFLLLIHQISLIQTCLYQLNLSSNVKAGVMTSSLLS